MKVTSVNNVKIYNVNTGRSLPQWITDRKKRKLLKEDVELRQVRVSVSKSLQWSIHRMRAESNG